MKTPSRDKANPRAVDARAFDWLNPHVLLAG